MSMSMRPKLPTPSWTLLRLIWMKLLPRSPRPWAISQKRSQRKYWSACNSGQAREIALGPLRGPRFFCAVPYLQDQLDPAQQHKDRLPRAALPGVPSRRCPTSGQASGRGLAPSRAVGPRAAPRPLRRARPHKGASAPALSSVWRRARAGLLAVAPPIVGPCGGRAAAGRRAVLVPPRRRGPWA